MKHPVSLLFLHCAFAGYRHFLTLLMCQRGRCWRKTGTGQTHQRRTRVTGPGQGRGATEIQVIRDLFEGPVNQNEKGELTPGVATRWQSNDNRIWTFTLRDDAKWSDGTPVTAQDFVYSWQRLVDPKTTSPFAVCCSGRH